MDNKRKIVIIGTGFVGMSTAFAILNQHLVDEMILIDVNKEKAIGEAMDLNHSLAFASTNIKISAGDYCDCRDAGIVLITAGVSQKEGESRPQLLKRNHYVFNDIITNLTASGFDGIILVATNPVDVMTRIAYELSGFDKTKVFGTGTSLDTARLRFLLGEYFNIDPKNIHAYVLGEHGESEIIPWSQAKVATKSIESVYNSHKELDFSSLTQIGEEVKNAAEKIIAAKGHTSFGIAMAAARIVKAVFGNENSVITACAKLEGEYSQNDVFAGVPCIINRTGIRSIIELELTKEELSGFDKSCSFLKETYNSIN